MEITDLNGKNNLQKQAALGRLTLKWPLLMVFSRLILAVVIQCLVALVFFHSAPSPILSAGKWWPVYGTLIDLGCLMLVVRLARKEGLRFRDLINFDAQRLGRDVLRGLLYILWFFPLATAGILGFSLLIYGSLQPPATYSALPGWAAFYALLLFPLIWGIMEQCTYQGYALPRLEALLPKKWMAIAVVVFGWGLQHIALPLTFDPRFMLYRFLSFIPLALVMTLIYLRTRRLIPFMVAHWLVDMVGVLTAVILPMVMK
jgi:uncharacterized protein